MTCNQPIAKVCQRSLDPFYLVSINRMKTPWPDSTMLDLRSVITISYLQCEHTQHSKDTQ